MEGQYELRTARGYVACSDTPAQDGQKTFPPSEEEVLCSVSEKEEKIEEPLTKGRAAIFSAPNLVSSDSRAREAVLRTIPGKPCKSGSTSGPSTPLTGRGGEQVRQSHPSDTGSKVRRWKRKRNVALTSIQYQGAQTSFGHLLSTFECGSSSPALSDLTEKCTEGPMPSSESTQSPCEEETAAVVATFGDDNASESDYHTHPDFSPTDKSKTDKVDLCWGENKIGDSERKVKSLNNSGNNDMVFKLEPSKRSHRGIVTLSSPDIKMAFNLQPGIKKTVGGNIQTEKTVKFQKHADRDKSRSWHNKGRPDKHSTDCQTSATTALLKDRSSFPLRKCFSHKKEDFSHLLAKYVPPCQGKRVINNTNISIRHGDGIKRQDSPWTTKDDASSELEYIVRVPESEETRSFKGLKYKNTENTMLYSNARIGETNPNQCDEIGLCKRSKRHNKETQGFAHGSVQQVRSSNDLRGLQNIGDHDHTLTHNVVSNCGKSNFSNVATCKFISGIPRPKACGLGLGVVPAQHSPLSGRPPQRKELDILMPNEPNEPNQATHQSIIQNDHNLVHTTKHQRTVSFRNVTCRGLSPACSECKVNQADVDEKYQGMKYLNSNDTTRTPVRRRFQQHGNGHECTHLRGTALQMLNKNDLNTPHTHSTPARGVPHIKQIEADYTPICVREMAKKLEALFGKSSRRTPHKHCEMDNSDLRSVPFDRKHKNSSFISPEPRKEAKIVSSKPMAKHYLYPEDSGTKCCKYRVSVSYTNKGQRNIQLKQDQSNPSNKKESSCSKSSVQSTIEKLSRFSLPLDTRDEQHTPGQPNMRTHARVIPSLSSTLMFTPKTSLAAQWNQGNGSRAIPLPFLDELRSVFKNRSEESLVANQTPIDQPSVDEVSELFLDTKCGTQECKPLAAPRTRVNLGQDPGSVKQHGNDNDAVIKVDGDNTSQSVLQVEERNNFLLVRPPSLAMLCKRLQSLQHVQTESTDQSVAVSFATTRLLFSEIEPTESVHHQDKTDVCMISPERPKGSQTWNKPGEGSKSAERLPQSADSNDTQRPVLSPSQALTMPPNARNAGNEDMHAANNDEGPNGLSKQMKQTTKQLSAQAHDYAQQINENTSAKQGQKHIRKESQPLNEQTPGKSCKFLSAHASNCQTPASTSNTSPGVQASTGEPEAMHPECPPKTAEEIICSVQPACRTAATQTPRREGATVDTSSRSDGKDRVHTNSESLRQPTCRNEKTQTPNCQPLNKSPAPQAPKGQIRPSSVGCPKKMDKKSSVQPACRTSATQTPRREGATVESSRRSNRKDRKEGFRTNTDSLGQPTCRNETTQTLKRQPPTSVSNKPSTARVEQSCRGRSEETAEDINSTVQPATRTSVTQTSCTGVTVGTQIEEIVDLTKSTNECSENMFPAALQAISSTLNEYGEGVFPTLVSVISGRISNEDGNPTDSPKQPIGQTETTLGVDGKSDSLKATASKTDTMDTLSSYSSERSLISSFTSVTKLTTDADSAVDLTQTISSSEERLVVPPKDTRAHLGSRSQTYVMPTLAEEQSVLFEDSVCWEEQKAKSTDGVENSKSISNVQANKSQLKGAFSVGNDTISNVHLAPRIGTNDSVSCKTNSVGSKSSVCFTDKRSSKDQLPKLQVSTSSPLRSLRTTESVERWVSEHACAATSGLEKIESDSESEVDSNPKLCKETRSSQGKNKNEGQTVNMEVKTQSNPDKLFEIEHTRKKCPSGYTPSSNPDARNKEDNNPSSSIVDALLSAVNRIKTVSPLDFQSCIGLSGSNEIEGKIISCSTDSFVTARSTNSQPVVDTLLPLSRVTSQDSPHRSCPPSNFPNLPDKHSSQKKHTLDCKKAAEVLALHTRTPEQLFSDTLKLSAPKICSQTQIEISDASVEGLLNSYQLIGKFIKSVLKKRHMNTTDIINQIESNYSTPRPCESESRYGTPIAEYVSSVSKVCRDEKDCTNEDTHSSRALAKQLNTVCDPHKSVIPTKDTSITNKKILMHASPFRIPLVVKNTTRKSENLSENQKPRSDESVHEISDRMQKPPNLRKGRKSPGHHQGELDIDDIERDADLEEFQDPPQDIAGLFTSQNTLFRQVGVGTPASVSVVTVSNRDIDQTGERHFTQKTVLNSVISEQQIIRLDMPPHQLSMVPPTQRSSVDQLTSPMPSGLTVSVTEGVTIQPSLLNSPVEETQSDNVVLKQRLAMFQTSQTSLTASNYAIESSPTTTQMRPGDCDSKEERNTNHLKGSLGLMRQLKTIPQNDQGRCSITDKGLLKTVFPAVCLTSQMKSPQGRSPSPSDDEVAHITNSLLSQTSSSRSLENFLTCTQKSTVSHSATYSRVTTTVSTPYPDMLQADTPSYQSAVEEGSVPSLSYVESLRLSNENRTGYHLRACRQRTKPVPDAGTASVMSVSPQSQKHYTMIMSENDKTEDLRKDESRLSLLSDMHQGARPKRVAERAERKRALVATNEILACNAMKILNINSDVARTAGELQRYQEDVANLSNICQMFSGWHSGEETCDLLSPSLPEKICELLHKCKDSYFSEDMQHQKIHLVIRLLEKMLSSLYVLMDKIGPGHNYAAQFRAQHKEALPDSTQERKRVSPPDTEETRRSPVDTLGQHTPTDPSSYSLTTYIPSSMDSADYFSASVPKSYESEVSFNEWNTAVGLNSLTGLHDSRKTQETQEHLQSNLPEPPKGSVHTNTTHRISTTNGLKTASVAQENQVYGENKPMPAVHAPRHIEKPYFHGKVDIMCRFLKIPMQRAADAAFQRQLFTCATTTQSSSCVCEHSEDSEEERSEGLGVMTNSGEVNSVTKTGCSSDQEAQRHYAENISVQTFADSFSEAEGFAIRHMNIISPELNVKTKTGEGGILSMVAHTDSLQGKASKMFAHEEFFTTPTVAFWKKNETNVVSATPGGSRKPEYPSYSLEEDKSFRTSKRDLPTGISMYTILEHPQWKSGSTNDQTTAPPHSEKEPQRSNTDTCRGQSHNISAQQNKPMCGLFQSTTSPDVFHSCDDVDNPVNKQTGRVPQKKAVVYTLGASFTQKQEGISEGSNMSLYSAVKPLQFECFSSPISSPVAGSSPQHTSPKGTYTEHPYTSPKTAISHNNLASQSICKNIQQDRQSANTAKGYAILREGSKSSWCEPVDIISRKNRAHDHTFQDRVSEMTSASTHSTQRKENNCNMNGSHDLQTLTKHRKNKIRVREETIKNDSPVPKETSFGCINKHSPKNSLSPLDEPSAVYVSLCVVSETTDPLTGHPLLKVTGTGRQSGSCLSQKKSAPRNVPIHTDGRTINGSPFQVDCGGGQQPGLPIWSNLPQDPVYSNLSKNQNAAATSPKSTLTSQTSLDSNQSVASSSNNLSESHRHHYGPASASPVSRPIPSPRRRVRPHAVDQNLQVVSPTLSVLSIVSSPFSVTSACSIKEQMSVREKIDLFTRKINNHTTSKTSQPHDKSGDISKGQVKEMCKKYQLNKNKRSQETSVPRVLKRTDKIAKSCKTFEATNEPGFTEKFPRSQTKRHPFCWRRTIHGISPEAKSRDMASAGATARHVDQTHEIKEHNSNSKRANDGLSFGKEKQEELPTARQKLQRRGSSPVPFIPPGRASRCVPRRKHISRISSASPRDRCTSNPGKSTNMNYSYGRSKSAVASTRRSSPAQIADNLPKRNQNDTINLKNGDDLGDRLNHKGSPKNLLSIPVKKEKRAVAVRNVHQVAKQKTENMEPTSKSNKEPQKRMLARHYNCYNVKTQTRSCIQAPRRKTLGKSPVLSVKRNEQGTKNIPRSGSSPTASPSLKYLQQRKPDILSSSADKISSSQSRCVDQTSLSPSRVQRESRMNKHKLNTPPVRKNVGKTPYQNQGVKIDKQTNCQHPSRPFESSSLKTTHCKSSPAVRPKSGTIERQRSSSSFRSVNLSTSSCDSFTSATDMWFIDTVQAKALHSQQTTKVFNEEEKFTEPTKTAEYVDPEVSSSLWTGTTDRPFPAPVPAQASCRRSLRASPYREPGQDGFGHYFTPRKNSQGASNPPRLPTFSNTPHRIQSYSTKQTWSPQRVASPMRGQPCFRDERNLYVTNQAKAVDKPVHKSKTSAVVKTTSAITLSKSMLAVSVSPLMDVPKCLGKLSRFLRDQIVSSHVCDKTQGNPNGLDAKTKGVANQKTGKHGCNIVSIPSPRSTNHKHLKNFSEHCQVAENTPPRCTFVDTNAHCPVHLSCACALRHSCNCHVRSMHEETQIRDYGRAGDTAHVKSAHACSKQRKALQPVNGFQWKQDVSNPPKNCYKVTLGLEVEDPAAADSVASDNKDVTISIGNIHLTRGARQNQNGSSAANEKLKGNLAVSEKEHAPVQKSTKRVIRCSSDMNENNADSKPKGKVYKSNEVRWQDADDGEDSVWFEARSSKTLQTKKPIISAQNHCTPDSVTSPSDSYTSVDATCRSHPVEKTTQLRQTAAQHGLNILQATRYTFTDLQSKREGTRPPASSSSSYLSIEAASDWHQGQGEKVHHQAESPRLQSNSSKFFKASSSSSSEMSTEGMATYTHAGHTLDSESDDRHQVRDLPLEANSQECVRESAALSSSEDGFTSRIVVQGGCADTDFILQRIYQQQLASTVSFNEPHPLAMCNGSFNNKVLNGNLEMGESRVLCNPQKGIISTSGLGRDGHLKTTGANCAKHSACNGTNSLTKRLLTLHTRHNESKCSGKPQGRSKSDSEAHKEHPRKVEEERTGDKYDIQTVPTNKGKTDEKFENYTERCSIHDSTHKTDNVQTKNEIKNKMMNAMPLKQNHPNCLKEYEETQNDERTHKRKSIHTITKNETLPDVGGVKEEGEQAAENKKGCQAHESPPVCYAHTQPRSVAKIEVTSFSDLHISTTEHLSPKVHVGRCYYSAKAPTGDEDVFFSPPGNDSPAIIGIKGQDDNEVEIVHKNVTGMTTDILKQCIDITQKAFVETNQEAPVRRKQKFPLHQVSFVGLSPAGTEQSEASKLPSPSPYYETHTLPGKVCRSNKVNISDDILGIGKKTKHTQTARTLAMVKDQLSKTKNTLIDSTFKSAEDSTKGNMTSRKKNESDKNKRRSPRTSRWHEKTEQGIQTISSDKTRTTNGNQRIDNGRAQKKASVDEHKTPRKHKHKSSVNQLHVLKQYDVAPSSKLIMRDKHEANSLFVCSRRNCSSTESTTGGFQLKASNLSSSVRSEPDLQSLPLQCAVHLKPQNPPSQPSKGKRKQDRENGCLQFLSPDYCSPLASTSNAPGVTSWEAGRPSNINQSNSPSRRTTQCEHLKVKRRQKSPPGKKPPGSLSVESSPKAKRGSSHKQTLSVARKIPGCSLHHSPKKHGHFIRPGNQTPDTDHPRVSNCFEKSLQKENTDSHPGAKTDFITSPKASGHVDVRRSNQNVLLTDSDSVNGRISKANPGLTDDFAAQNKTFNRTLSHEESSYTRNGQRKMSRKNNNDNSPKRTTKFKITAEPSMDRSKPPTFKIEVSPPSESDSDRSVTRVVKLEESRSPDPSAKLTMTEYSSQKNNEDSEVLQHSFPSCLVKEPKTKAKADVEMPKAKANVEVPFEYERSYSTFRGTFPSPRGGIGIPATDKEMVCKQSTSEEGDVAEFKVLATSPSRAPRTSSPKTYSVEATIKNKDCSPQRLQRQVTVNISHSQHIHSGGEGCCVDRSQKMCCLCGEDKDETSDEVTIHISEQGRKRNDFTSQGMSVTTRRSSSPWYKSKHSDDDQAICSVSNHVCNVHISPVSSTIPQKRRKHCFSTVDFKPNDCGMEMMSQALAKLKKEPQMKTKKKPSRKIKNFRLLRKSSSSVVSVVSHITISGEVDNQLKTTHSLSYKRNAKPKRLSPQEVMSARRLQSARWALRAQEKLSRQTQANLSVLRKSMQATRRRIEDENCKRRQRQIQAAMKRALQKHRNKEARGKSCQFTDTRIQMDDSYIRCCSSSCQMETASSGDSSDASFTEGVSSVTSEAGRPSCFKHPARQFESENDSSSTTLSDSPAIDRLCSSCVQQVCTRHQQQIELSYNSGTADPSCHAMTSMKSGFCFPLHTCKHSSAPTQGVHEPPSYCSQTHRSVRELNKTNITTESNRDNILKVHGEYLDKLQRLARHLASGSITNAAMRETDGEGRATHTVQSRRSQSEVRYLLTLEDLSRLVAAVNVKTSDGGITRRWQSSYAVNLQPSSPPSRRPKDQPRGQLSGQTGSAAQFTVYSSAPVRHSRTFLAVNEQTECFEERSHAVQSKPRIIYRLTDSKNLITKHRDAMKQTNPFKRATSRRRAQNSVRITPSVYIAASETHLHTCTDEQTADISTHSLEITSLASTSSQETFLYCDTDSSMNVYPTLRPSGVSGYQSSCSSIRIHRFTAAGDSVKLKPKWRPKPNGLSSESIVAARVHPQKKETHGRSCVHSMLNTSKPFQRTTVVEETHGLSPDNRHLSKVALAFSKGNPAVGVSMLSGIPRQQKTNCRKNVRVSTGISEVSLTRVMPVNMPDLEEDAQTSQANIRSRCPLHMKKPNYKSYTFSKQQNRGTKPKCSNGNVIYNHANATSCSLGTKSKQKRFHVSQSLTSVTSVDSETEDYGHARQSFLEKKTRFYDAENTTFCNANMAFKCPLHRNRNANMSRKTRHNNQDNSCVNIQFGFPARARARSKREGSPSVQPGGIQGVALIHRPHEVEPHSVPSLQILRSEVRKCVQRNMRRVSQMNPEAMPNVSYQQLLRLHGRVLHQLNHTSRWDAESVNRVFRDVVYQWYLHYHQPDIFTHLAA